MIKDVVIRMRSIHNSDEGEDDVMEFTTDGEYFVDGDTYCFSYLETEVTGMEGTRTSVFVRPNEVVIDRDGAVTSRMILREREKNRFLYTTPFGNATLNVSTRSIDKCFDEHGGRLTVDYVLDMEHTVVSRNRFCVQVKERHSAQ